MITPELLRFRSVLAMMAAVLAALEGLWHRLWNVTCGERLQAAMSVVGPRHGMSMRIGAWARAEATVAPWSSGGQLTDTRSIWSAGRHGADGFMSIQHCRVRRPWQQAVHAVVEPSGLGI